MDREALKIKLAWQVAFEARTCPDLATLSAAAGDENLEAHLASCPSCREKKALPAAEREAWKTLREALLPFAGNGALPDKSVGQVWTLDPALAGWNENHRYLKPPVVVLLEQTPVGSGWRVAQLYSDKTLASSGDVPLTDRFGFAQGWNCYPVKEQMLARCLGAVSDSDLAAVRAAGAEKHHPAETDSVLSFFRQLEIQIGSRVSVPVVLELVGEYEEAVQLSHEEVCRRIFQTVASAVQALAGCIVPNVKGIYETVAGAVLPEGPVTASGKGFTLPANHVRSASGKVVVEPSHASIIVDQWDGEGYLVSGSLAAPFLYPVQVLGQLKREGGAPLEARVLLKASTQNFLLFFEGATEAECRLEKVQLLLVSHE